MFGKKKSGLPQYVDLGYKRLRIEWITAHPLDGGELGSVNIHQSVIRIVKERHPDPRELMDTLIHECLHAIWRSAHLPEEGDHSAHPPGEEHVVTILSRGLTELMQRNPHLLDWFKEQAEG